MATEHEMDFRGLHVLVVRGKFENLRQKDVGIDLTLGTKGAIIGALDEACGSKMGRYHLMRILFPDMWQNGERPSTQDLNKADWFALWAWAKPEKDESPTGDNKWHGTDYLRQQANDIMMET